MATASFRARLANMGGGRVILSKPMNTLSSSPSTKLLGQCVTLTLANPASRNAVSGRMMIDLEECVTRLERDPAYSEVSVIVLKGEGTFFCAGSELGESASGLPDPIDGLDMCIFMQDVTRRFAELSAVSVALVRGGAYGGGTELATSCDLRLMGENAVYKMVHPTMGLAPAWGGATRLARLLGPNKATRVLCGSLKLTGKECHDKWGLADAVFDDSLDVKVLKHQASEEETATAHQRALTAVESYILPFLTSPAAAVRGCKGALTYDATLDQCYGNEKIVFGNLWGGPANRAAIEAFKTKHHHN